MDDKLARLRHILASAPTPTNDNEATTDTKRPAAITLDRPLFCDVSEWVMGWARENNIVLHEHIIGNFLIDCYATVDSYLKENPATSHGKLQRWLISQLEELY